MFNKRFIKCIIGAVCIFILVIILIGGKTILEKKTALEVINKFFQSNYEYTKVSSSNYSYSDEDVVYKGKIIYEPYQGIEEYVSGSSIIKTVYTYEEDNKIYGDTQLELEPGKYTWTKKQIMNKLNSQYVKEDLKFKHAGSKKEKGNELEVYRTSYEYPVFLNDDDAKMYSTINVNYYLDMKNKKVVKIIIDDSEYQQDYQILQKMENENITEDEARKQFIESNESVKSITTITVSNIDESTKNQN